MTLDMQHMLITPPDVQVYMIAIAVSSIILGDIGMNYTDLL